MSNYIDYGLSLKHMSVLSGVSISTLYKYIQSQNIEPLANLTRRGAKYSISSVRRIMNHFYAKKHPIDETMKRIAGFHFKGGTGKSSISTELSVMLSLLGYNVLLVDGDQQGHASHSLGLDYSYKLYTLYDCVKNNMSVEDVIHHLYDGLDCIPSNLSLASMEETLKDLEERKRVEIVNNILGTIDSKYDFIVFDTAPSITDLNRGIFYYSNLLNVICDTQPQSVQSLEHIMEYLNDFCSKYEKTPPKLVIIPNKYEDRVSSSIETMTYLQNNWSGYIIEDFAVRKSEDFPRAFLEQKPFSFTCRVNSIAFEDVAEVTRHIVDICEKK